MAILPKGADWLTYKGKYKHPHADAVQHKTRRAIKSGRLIKPSACSKCGRTDKPIQAHHADYEKPLDVTWLCTGCHADIHNGEKYGRSITVEPIVLTSLVSEQDQKNLLKVTKCSIEREERARICRGDFQVVRKD